MKRIFLYVRPMACERRELDAQKLCTYFEKNNYQIVKNPKYADIILFISCASVDLAVEDSLKIIERLKSYDAELIVAGCLPEVEKERLSKIFSGRYISTKNLNKIDDLFPEHNVKFKDINDANRIYLNIDKRTVFGIVKLIFHKIHWLNNFYLKIKNHLLCCLFKKHSLIFRELFYKSYFHIRISDGCNGNCSYCTIHKSVGPLRSKPIKLCIEEFNKGLQRGFTKFCINAVESGSYGTDIGNSLPELLEKLTNQKCTYQFLIKSLNPNWVVKYIDELEHILKKQKIEGMIIPIQTSNRRMLKLMHRYSNVEKIKDAILRLQKADPQLAIYTHLIVGFPTETKEELKHTLNFVKEVGFHGGCVYPFSVRSGTLSETINPKISKKEIKHRIQYVKKYLKNNRYDLISIPFSNFSIFSKK